MKNIFLFGECMVELMTTARSPLVNTMKQSFAGDVFNTAVYLKRTFSQAKVHLVTAVGKDEFSLDMIQYFENESIGTDFVFQSDDKIPGLYSIQLDDAGERSFTYWRENSAARSVMSFINDDISQQFNPGDVFFFSGISVGVVKPDDRDNFWRFVNQLKAAGITIVFDLNYRPKLWASEDEAREQFRLAFQAADILLPGVDDFAAIFALDQVEEIIAFFAQYDYQELVIKNGDKNVYCISAAEQEIVDVTPVAKVVDTTSAGDSFNGGYLSARLAGKSIADSVEFANQVAGFVIQHPGAIVDQAAFSARFN